jgi:hypothetical protein
MRGTLDVYKSYTRVFCCSDAVRAIQDAGERATAPGFAEGKICDKEHLDHARDRGLVVIIPKM